MKKLLIIALLMLALVITAVACQPTPDEPDTSADEVTTAETPTEAPTEVPTEKPTEAPTEAPTEPPAVELDDSWFDNMLVIGDSRFHGMYNYYRFGEAYYFTSIGMNIYNVHGTWASDKGHYECSIYETLNTMYFDKVLIGIGLNECDYEHTYIQAGFQKLIDLIHSYHPDAKIILTSVMMVTEKKAASDDCFSIENLSAINDIIGSFADNEKVFYIDVNEWAVDETGYIPDDIFYFPSATMDEMRRFYKGMYPNFDNDLYNRLFEVFQLPRRGQIRRFSKGMQKQAAFHLAICTRPDVMILDEPVDGLDPVMRRQVWSLILSDVAQRGTTVLVSSHNLRELEDVCDHVGIMDHGKMLLERSLADMQGATHKLQMVGQLPEGLEVLHESSSGRLKTYVVRGSAEEITAKLNAANPTYFDVLPLSLEEIFIYELGGVNYEVKNIVL